MRKLVYLLVCLAMAVSAAAQTPQQRMSREQLAETQAKYIARELAFDDNVTRQFITISAIARRRYGLSVREAARTVLCRSVSTGVRNCSTSARSTTGYTESS